MSDNYMSDNCGNQINENGHWGAGPGLGAAGPADLQLFQNSITTDLLGESRDNTPSLLAAER